MRLIFGGHRRRRSQHTLTRTLSLYRGLDWVYSHAQSRWCQQHLLSQGCVLETAPRVVTVGRIHIPRTGKRIKSFPLPRCSSRVNWWSCLLYDLLQHVNFCIFHFETYWYSVVFGGRRKCPLRNCQRNWKGSVKKTWCDSCFFWEHSLSVWTAAFQRCKLN